MTEIAHEATEKLDEIPQIVSGMTEIVSAV
jgi:hypothetical protein